MTDITIPVPHSCTMTIQSPIIRTRITELFKCRYPIILPGMSWISEPELVAAVCNAGGLGILATGPLNDRETRQSIHTIRSLTNRPFGVGATLLMPGAADNARVALQEQVPVINVSLGKPDWIAKEAKQYGGVLLSTVTNAKHAEAAIASGADALMVTGHEAAAHGGDVTSLTLIPSLASQFPDIPIVAAGGFADGRGLAAALALGADGVAMGSRFAVSVESPLAQATKDAIIAADESQTIYGKNFDGIHARVLKTALSERLMKKRPSLPTTIYRALLAARQLNIPMWKVLPGLITQWDKMYTIAQFGAATNSITKATVDGNVEEGVQFIGQSCGMIKEILTVDEIVQRAVNQAFEVYSRNLALFQEQQ